MVRAPAAAARSGSPGPHVPFIAFRKEKLRNGLTVILHEDRSSPAAAIVVMYHVGSKNEVPGRTGFAHLFEHIIFKGSAHVGDGEHFSLLQKFGASVNGSTTEDRTNYYETVPPGCMELGLYLEADRMGSLLETLTQEKLDNQRDVVLNECRQRYENQPYGTAHERMLGELYPEGHPYRWPVIGYPEDLTRATLDDVRAFFGTYYSPANACIALAGAVDAGSAKGWIQEYFGRIRGGKPPRRPVVRRIQLREERRLILEDRVHLPRLYLTWHTAPAFTRGDAVLDVLTDILGSGKSSRLYKSLVVEHQIAQSVDAYQHGLERAGMTTIEVTARPDVPLRAVEQSVLRELQRISTDGVTPGEIQASLNSQESRFVGALTTAQGRANLLATYHTLTGNPGNINTELARYAHMRRAEVTQRARSLLSTPRVVLSVIPAGRRDLAAAITGIHGKRGRTA